MKLLIGIPAYNEETTLDRVIKGIPKHLKSIDQIDVLVVDDGSTDGTKEIVQKNKVLLLRHLVNRGLGGALKTILAFASQKEYNFLVTLDADGQHDTSDISKILQPVISGKFDVVIGTRWKSTSRVPISRYIVNKVANLVTLLLFGISTSDSQSGFRALNKKAICKIILISDGMEVSSEFFKEIFRNKLKFGEISVKNIYTEYSTAKGQKISNSANVFFQLLLRFLRQ
mgnify:CR=1 FL=1